MADYKFTAALNADQIPPITRNQQRSIVIAGLDNRLKNPAVSNMTNQDNNAVNMPQVIYAENVIPTSGGLKSVGYTKVQNAAIPANARFDDIYILRDTNETTWNFSPASGYNFVCNLDFGTPWVSTSPVAGAPLATTAQFSIAYVNGVTYICYAGVYLGEWDGAVFIDRSAALVGVAIANVKAICGSGNYLVLVTADSSVKWSSLTNPLDFTISVITGAGSQIPVDIRGPASYLTPTSGGFLIHCTSNTVAAIYTQNSAAPWIFREVKTSGGLNNDNTRVTKDGTNGQVFMYSTNGIQTLNLRDAETIHAQVSDFLGSRLIESFDSTTNIFTLTKYGTDLKVKANLLNGRYFCLSYGSVLPYTYVLVFDLILKRWGKLKFTHVDIVTSYGDYKETMYALQGDGTVYQLIMDDRTAADSGVLILGRYQLNRANRICSQELELELLDATEAVTADVLVYDNGTVPSYAVHMTAAESTDNYRLFQAQVEGESLAFAIKGTFTIASAILTFTKGAGTNS